MRSTFDVIIREEKINVSKLKKKNIKVSFRCFTKRAKWN